MINCDIAFIGNYKGIIIIIIITKIFVVKFGRR